MNLSDINEIAASKWQEYDAITTSCSEDWEQRLQAKLDKSSGNTTKGISNFGLVLILLALLNLGVVFFSTYKKSVPIQPREEEFQTLSHELLLTVNN